MNLLHLDSSPLGAYSVSRELTAAIVAAWQTAHPGSTTTVRDLAAQPLSHWSPVSDADQPAAREGGEVLDEFLAADAVVIGAPMYNFGIPSQLKAWIDRIVIAGKTFRYTETGPQGLAGAKKVIIASTRGGIYSAGPSAVADFQEAYLRQVFGFIGVTDLEFVRAEGLALGAEQKTEAVRSAHASIRERERMAA